MGFIAGQIEQRGLKTAAVQELEPGISKMMVSRLKDLDRSACSLPRLKRIAEALGWACEDDCKVAA